EVAALGPLVPRVDGGDLDRGLRPGQVGAYGRQRGPELVGRVAGQDRLERVADLVERVGLRRPRAGVPSGRDVGQVGHVELRLDVGPAGFGCRPYRAVRCADAL